MDLAIILVHYHTPHLLARAVGALRADLAASGLKAEWRVVDNGSTPTDRAALGRLGLPILSPGANVGYAGGLNRGVAATRAPVLCLMNPDVEVFPGCLAALLDVLEAGAAAVSPRLYLDAGRRLRLPPNERRTRRHELLRCLARRGPPWARWARRSWRRHARRFWRARAPLATTHLSGAFLMARRDAWDAAGPFDEGYRLYFEETDWLIRLRRLGRTACFVPHAEAWHRYNQSAGRAEAEAARQYTASATRFARRHYGVAFTRALRLLSPPAGARPAAPPLPPGPPELDLTRLPANVRRPLWVELADGARGFPAAAEIIDDATVRSWRLPEDVWMHLAPGSYRLYLVDDAGEEMAGFHFNRPPVPRGQPVSSG